MPNPETRVMPDALKAYMKEVFLRIGLPEADAETGADALLWANLRGLDSHGVRWIPHFARFAEQDHLRPRPDIRTIHESPATLFIDGDRGLGSVVSVHAMRRALEKAKEAGVCWVLVRDMVTPLAIGYSLRLAAREDMAGIMFAVARPNMVPTGALAPGVHNAPFAIAVPRAEGEPVMLDMATSVAAAGRIDVARARGVPIPEGWAIDPEGRPTTDPQQASMVLPAGGHKGYGLSFMIECLASLASGNPQAAPSILGTLTDRRHQENAVVVAVDLSRFRPPEDFKRDVEELIGAVKGLRRAEGVEEIFVPGDPEERTRAEREREGIPIPAPTAEELRAIAKKLGLKAPRGL